MQLGHVKGVTIHLVQLVLDFGQVRVQLVVHPTGHEAFGEEFALGATHGTARRPRRSEDSRAARGERGNEGTRACRDSGGGVPPLLLSHLSRPLGAGRDRLEIGPRESRPPRLSFSWRVVGTGNEGTRACRDSGGGVPPLLLSHLSRPLGAGRDRLEIGPRESRPPRLSFSWRVVAGRRVPLSPP